MPPPEHVYAQIRTEMTSIVGSCRALAMGEYAVVGAAMAGLCGATTSVTIGAIGLALAITMRAATRLGTNWYFSVIRQGSYLLAAWELPERDRCPSHQSETWWILANRSLSFMSRNDRLVPQGHRIADDLRFFYFQQIWLCIAGFAVLLVRLLWTEAESRAWTGYFLPDSGAIVLSSAAGLYFLLSAWDAWRMHRNLGEAIRRQLDQWREYLRWRHEMDSTYLASLDAPSLETTPAPLLEVRLGRYRFPLFH